MSVRFCFRPDLLPYRLSNRMNCLVSRVTPGYIPTVHYACILYIRMCVNNECTAHKCGVILRVSVSSALLTVLHPIVLISSGFGHLFERLESSSCLASNAVTKPFCYCAITGAPSGKLRLYLRGARRAPN